LKSEKEKKRGSRLQKKKKTKQNKTKQPNLSFLFVSDRTLGGFAFFVFKTEWLISKTQKKMKSLFEE
jgi:hypothetical protein